MDYNILEEYRFQRHKKRVFLLSLAILTVALIFLSLFAGNRSLSAEEILDVIVAHIQNRPLEMYSKEWIDDYAIWNVRLPRSLYGVLAGAILGIAGATLQTTLDNPLADAYTTGISSGALLGVSVSMILGIDIIEVGALGNVGVLINAFVFSLIPVGIMVLIVPFTRGNSTSMILVGVAVTYIFTTADTLLMVLTDSETMAEVYTWQVGSLSSASWDDFIATMAIGLPGCIVLSIMANKLNIMASGEKTAKSLGLDIENFRILCLVVCTFTVSIVVCHVGIIGFVGLVSPHIIRSVVGGNNKYVLVGSALFGGAFLILADILCRVISNSDAVPVGVIMSFVGAPLFILLIMRRKSNVA